MRLIIIVAVAIISLMLLTGCGEIKYIKVHFVKTVEPYYDRCLTEDNVSVKCYNCADISEWQYCYMGYSMEADNICLC